MTSLNPNDALLTDNLSRRQPYHYTVVGTGDVPSERISTDDTVPPRTFPQIEPVYSRYRYYSRLVPPGSEENALQIPNHVIPPAFFQPPVIPGILDARTGKQSSIITIFAIWNTMMGTSLLSMPWAIEQAGLGLGLFLMIFIAAICLYTAWRILKTYSIYEESLTMSDFPDLCRHLLGRFGEWSSIAFSAVALFGACVVYWVLMSNFLYNTGKVIYDSIVGNLTSNGTDELLCPHPPSNVSKSSFFLSVDYSEYFSTYWSIDLTVPIYLAVILGPLTCLKSATFFTKFNAFGSLSVFYILSFVITKASKWGFNVDFADITLSTYVPLARTTFPSLTGILALALFVHNAVVTIMKNNKQQENNSRDLCFAFCLVTSTYVCVGSLFYLSFPIAKGCIEDNFLNNFPIADLMTIIARIFLFLQMMTVFPLLTYILRTQLLYALFESVYPSWVHVFGLNIVLLTTCVLFAIFLPQVGTITRFSGSICGLVYVFTLPSLIHLVSLRRQQKLTFISAFLHSMIILVGLMNLASQFFVISD